MGPCTPCVREWQCTNFLIPAPEQRIGSLVGSRAKTFLEALDIQPALLQASRPVLVPLRPGEAG